MKPDLDQATSASSSLAERIAAVLRGRIVSGSLAPMAPVRQDHVAAEFGASHVPVREAFRLLEGQGLVVAEPRRGVRVAPLEPGHVREIVRMRAKLEPLALEESLPNLSCADLDEARAAIAEGEASDDITAWERANWRFHSALYKPCGMPRLLRSIEELHLAGARYLHAAWRTLDWRGRSDEEHREILARLERGEGDLAASALSRHIEAAGRAVIADALKGRSGQSG